MVGVRKTDNASLARIHEFDGYGFIDGRMLVGRGKIEGDDIFAAPIEMDIISRAIDHRITTIKDMGIDYAEYIVAFLATGL